MAFGARQAQHAAAVKIGCFVYDIPGLLAGESRFMLHRLIVFLPSSLYERRTSKWGIRWQKSRRYCKPRAGKGSLHTHCKSSMQLHTSPAFFITRWTLFLLSRCALHDFLCPFSFFPLFTLLWTYIESSEFLWSLILRLVITIVGGKNQVNPSVSVVCYGGKQRGQSFIFDFWDWCTLIKVNLIVRMLTNY